MSASRNKTALKQKIEEFEKLLSDGPAGRHLQKWCNVMLERRVNYVSVLLAQIVVRSVDGLYVLGELVREGMTSWAGSCGPIEEWEQMYRRSRSTMQRVLDQFGTVPQTWREVIGIPSEVGPVRVGTALRISGLVIRDIERHGTEKFDQEMRNYLKSPEAASNLAKMQEFKQKCFDDSLSFGLASDMSEEQAAACMQEREVQFFMLVLLPCWLEYGESASKLLQHAEARNLNALEQLLRVDKRVIFFPGIREIVDGANRNRMEGAFALQVDAFGGKPKTLWKRDGVRVALSKFILSRSRQISQIHPIFGPPLTKRDVLEAFHAAARDRGLKRDKTLPLDEETFSKRITREKRFGTSAPWDIFSA